MSEDLQSLLEKINRDTPVSVELGLQTVHPQSICYIRRGYERIVEKFAALGADIRLILD